MHIVTYCSSLGCIGKVTLMDLSQKQFSGNGLSQWDGFSALEHIFSLI